MFESTLEAQALQQRDRHFGTLSAAVVAHVAIGLTILFVTALIVPPVHPPDLPPIVIAILPRIPLGELAPRPAAQAPKKGSETAKPGRAVVVPRAPKPTAPTETPGVLRAPAPDSPPAGPDGPGDGAFGDPNGSPSGVPGGHGSDEGGGGDDAVSGPLYVTGDMQRPVLLVRVEPQYPEAARLARLGGRVTVRAVIGQDGTIESAEVVASKNPLFDQAALEAVRRWRYSPALMNGTPVRVYFTVVVDFVLR